jgi:DMSO/TMAO reductase YedYZ molybdopterin-dependent catalytic subunit
MNENEKNKDAIDEGASPPLEDAVNVAGVILPEVAGTILNIQSDPKQASQTDAAAAPPIIDASKGSSPGEEEELHKLEPNRQIFISVKDRIVEKSPEIILQDRRILLKSNRRDFLLFGAGVAAAAGGYLWLMPDDIKEKFGLRVGADSLKDKFLNSVLDFDDRVAQALYSKDRLLPTYSKSEMTQLPNNYAGQTPNPSYLSSWKLRVHGLANEKVRSFTIQQLHNEFRHYDQITRLVCVEGWSAISWWGGFRFADFIKAYPPAAGTKWIQLRSQVNLDSDGNSDPYYVSFDIDSALHPQTLLATHHQGEILEIEHGAPLRLLAPMKLGLKNIKAVTSIHYCSDPPDDYWNKDGYSYYDGI